MTFAEHVRHRPWSAALFLVVICGVLATLISLAFPWWLIFQSRAALTRSVASYITPSHDETCSRESNEKFVCSMELQGGYDSVPATFYYDVPVNRRGCWTATIEHTAFGGSPPEAPERIEGCVRAWHFLD